MKSIETRPYVCIIPTKKVFEEGRIYMCTIENDETFIFTDQQSQIQRLTKQAVDWFFDPVNFLRHESEYDETEINRIQLSNDLWLFNAIDCRYYKVENIIVERLSSDTNCAVYVKTDQKFRDYSSLIDINLFELNDTVKFKW